VRSSRGLSASVRQRRHTSTAVRHLQVRAERCSRVSGAQCLGAVCSAWMDGGQRAPVVVGRWQMAVHGGKRKWQAAHTCRHCGQQMVGSAQCTVALHGGRWMVWVHYRSASCNMRLPPTSPSHPGAPTPAPALYLAGRGCQRPWSLQGIASRQGLVHESTLHSANSCTPRQGQRSTGLEAGA